MSFAVIETGGKQYKVSASNILKVEKLNIQKGKKVEFKKVLLLNDDKTTEIGNPIISGAIVEGLLLENIKDKKILVFKKRRRQNSRKKYGHRQPLSKIQITKILSKNGKIISEIKDILSGQSEIRYEIQGVYGVFDVVLKIISEDASNLRSVITNKIRRIPQVQSTLTMMVIDEQEKS